MAKIKKRKLHWKPSDSPQVVGYRLYWSEGEKVDYDSPSANLGNVTEVLLPDGIEGFAPGKGPIEFGITAVDELGNESDMVVFSAAYQFNVPQAPQDVSMEALDEYHSTATAKEEAPSSVKPIQLYEKGVYCLKSPQEEPKDDSSAVEILEEENASLKYYGQSDLE